MQFKDYVLERIRAGAWPPGFRVPSENELVREFGISRMTVNRALRELMHEGFLNRVHGVGTFVRELPHQASLIELRNIAEEIRERGHSHSAQVVEKGEVAAAAELAARFERDRGAALFHVLLVHAEDGTPVQIEDRFVNPAVAPDFLAQDFTAHTPTEYLVSVAPVGELEHVVKASMPTPRQQKLLHMAAGEPCLVMHRRSWSWGAVASVATMIYPAGRYELRGRYKTTPMGTLAGSNREDRSKDASG
jgi:GntR family histidine utilization transcriptional repressor